MKKIFWMLAVCLPVMLTSCELPGSDKDDDDEPEVVTPGTGVENDDEDEPINADPGTSAKDYYMMPCVKWGSTQSNVISFMDNVGGFRLLSEESDEETLFFDSLNTDWSNGMPWYIYDFEDNSLYASGIVTQTSEVNKVETWVKSMGFTYSKFLTEEIDFDNESAKIYVKGNIEDADMICVICTELSYMPMLECIFVSIEMTRSEAGIKAKVAKAMGAVK